MFSMPESALETEFGRGLPARPIFGATDDEDSRERTRIWLERNRAKLCAALSSSAKVKSAIGEGPEANRVELAAACLDALAMTFSAVPLAALSVLIVRRGIREVCRPELGL